MADTFDRSLAHWSEEKRHGMDDFYVLATADYRHLAEAFDWTDWLRSAEKHAGGALRLLDVACGSGKFPTALIRHGGLDNASLKPVDYALLDPSAFSIAEARSQLAAPFVPGAEFETTLQDLPAPAKSFDVVWATHALYALPRFELKAGLTRFLDVMSGRGFIAHARESAHYIRFYQAFLKDFNDGVGEPYTAAEDIISTLEDLGARLTVKDISYTQTVDASASPTVEGYLQRCVFDDTHSLEALCAAPNTGPYLQECRRDGPWRFEQSVAMIFIQG